MFARRTSTFALTIALRAAAAPASPRTTGRPGRRG